MQAVADIIDVPSADDAVAIVLYTWAKEDWDSEAFTRIDKSGKWQYYQLCDRDEIVVERVEAAHDCEEPRGLAEPTKRELVPRLKRGRARPVGR